MEIILLNFEIKNEAIKQYHDYLLGVYSNESIEKEVRYEVAKRIDVIQNLVSIYEQDNPLEYEDLTWVEIGDPLLPEDRRVFHKSLLKQLGRVKDNT